MIVVSIFRILLNRVIQKFTDCQKESPDYVFKILKRLNSIKQASNENKDIQLSDGKSLRRLSG